MDKQAKEARDMVKGMSFKQKIKHFWDYYKIHTIVVIVVAAFIGGTIYQAVTREKFDMEIYYYGSVALDDEKITEFEEYLSQFIEDTDGDGEKKINIVTVETGNPDPQYQMAISQKFAAELSAGACSAYIFDDSFYEYALDSGEDIFESKLNLSENHEASEILGIPDVPLYWCTRTIYEREAKKEEAVLMYDNAKRIEESLK